MTRQRRRRLAQKGITVKTLELRPKGPEYTIPLPDGTVLTRNESPWCELVRTVANSSPMGATGTPAGFTPDLMRKRLRITKALDALDDDATTMELEDGDVTELVSALSGVRWNRMSEWMIEFCDAVEALPKQKAE